ncbi:integrin alpha-9-like [Mercenaria mercenaria]|uniref:integrin alpha-9-like n=1 Tax=Mercenaria mercenaria TaxID=6596 RepID=UPI00234FB384|nr:integrin alpha-9-like [Mercenaria mercenaria]
MSILLYDNIMIFHLYFCTVITFIVGFNTNVKHVVKLHGFNEPGSYFGFSVGIGYNKNTAKNVILVGAPRSNDPALPDVPRPGVVFACTAYQKIWNCSKLDIYNDSDLHEDVLVRRNESWLGGSIYVSASNIVATCAHKSDDWRDMYLDGECFEFPLEDIPSVSFSVRTYRGMSHHSANFGFGTSVHYTKVGRVMTYIIIG